MPKFSADVKVILKARVTLTAKDEGEARRVLETCALQYDVQGFQYERVVGPIEKQEDE